MLWCKETFEQHFDHNNCRLFPLQQQLFDFVDLAAVKESECAWWCFSIEFPSASEVSRLLSRHTTSGRAVPLFQRVHQPAMTESGSNDGCGCAGLRKRPREDFALLYGETPLSRQTRMFLAATLAGVHAILTTIDARQLHLYEIIREGMPCHLYFDVEREGNYVGLRTSICVEDEDSDSSSVLVENYASVCVEEEVCGKKSTVFECSTSRYQELCRRAVDRTPPGVCGLDCAIEPDNKDTCDILLHELEVFVRERFPSLVPLTQPSEKGERSVFEEVWVLQSVPLVGVAAKFSQHYVIKFCNTVFDSTASVKAFVREFVNYIGEHAAQQSRIHRSLFFHGPPVWYAVFHELTPDYPRNTLPYLPRKCVVDEAVYSKNRMMRCLGSCKLGKTSVLRVYRHYQHGERRPLFSTAVAAAPTLETLLATLISYRAFGSEAAQKLHVEGQAAEGGITNKEMLLFKTVDSPSNALSGSAQRSSDSPELDDDAVRQLVGFLETAYANVSRTECSVLRPRKLHKRFLTFQVRGTRYCQHVGREHKSNNVYLVVDLEKRTFVQKCFDPDCASYRSPPLPLDNPSFVKK